MTFEVHYWKADSFFKKHGKFITESWDRYSLEFHMLNTSQEQIKLLQEAKQYFSEKKNIDSASQLALMKWFNRNINHAQEYVNANGSASPTQAHQRNETLNTGESHSTGEPVEKINWQGTETELVFLMELLIQEGFLKSGRHWKMVEEHFLVKGKLLKPKQLSQTYQNLPVKGPRKAQILESILSQVSSSED